MAADYDVIPQIERYGCVVDFLSRAGLLQEAHEFIMSMPVKPDGSKGEDVDESSRGEEDKWVEFNHC